MNALYPQLQGIAGRILEKYGIQVLITTDTGSYRTNAVFGVKDERSEPGSTPTSLEDESCMIPGSVKIVPKAQDTLTVGGKVWTIIDVKKTAPAGLPVYYRLGLST